MNHDHPWRDDAGRARTPRAAIRGGGWGNGSNAGVFSLNLNNAPSIVNNNVGFRGAISSWI